MNGINDISFHCKNTQRILFYIHVELPGGEKCENRGGREVRPVTHRETRGGSRDTLHSLGRVERPT